MSHIFSTFQILLPFRKFRIICACRKFTENLTKLANNFQNCPPSENPTSFTRHHLTHPANSRNETARVLRIAYPTPVASFARLNRAFLLQSADAELFNEANFSSNGISNGLKSREKKRAEHNLSRTLVSAQLSDFQHEATYSTNSSVRNRHVRV